jgi:hypothetical protein
MMQYHVIRNGSLDLQLISDLKIDVSHGDHCHLGIDPELLDGSCGNLHRSLIFLMLLDLPTQNDS